MHVYFITFKSYPPHKVIADNIIEAINKYQAYCIKRNITDYEQKLNDMTSIKYIEDFDYIQ